MNRAYKLFDKDYVEALLWRKLKPLYPHLVSIDRISIDPHKKHIWESTYHVVVEYRVYCTDDKGVSFVLPIFCSAHDSEPRRNVYDVLHFLWDNGFEGDEFSVPHPLFFSEYLNGVFYRGVTGQNLRYYIRQIDRDEVMAILPRTARWFARLHSLPTDNVRNFNEGNSRIRTVVPGVEKILEEIGRKYPDYSELYKKAYERFIEREERFLASTPQRWLIHGDAHPENIIRMSADKLGVIDFSDFSLSDFARDLGCFTQQLWYMMEKIDWSDEDIAAAQKLFLDEYRKASGCVYDKGLQERIDSYYDWTCLRTVTYLLLSGVIEKNAERLTRIQYLLGVIRERLDL